MMLGSAMPIMEDSFDPYYAQPERKLTSHKLLSPGAGQEGHRRTFMELRGKVGCHKNSL